MAGVSPKEIQVAEVHDCFTIAEIMAYEDLGFCEKGQGGQYISEKRAYIGGDTAVNVDGGLKAKGHPIGATGVSMHALTAMQLCGEAGEMQVKDPKLGGIFNMGGAAVANYVSVLERVG